MLVPVALLFILGLLLMNIEDFRLKCLALKEVSEGTPFGPDVLVFKVADKMFSTLALSEESARANLKCDPERAILLREENMAILPGYHMSKKHWNTLLIEELDDELIDDLILHSYELVVSGLPKSVQQRLKDENG